MSVYIITDFSILLLQSISRPSGASAPRLASDLLIDGSAIAPVQKQPQTQVVFVAHPIVVSTKSTTQFPTS